MPAPLTLKQVIAGIFAPTFAGPLPASLDSPEARVLLLAIGSQESRFEFRQQINGPARGFWQFERAGGVQGVLNHPSAKPYLPGLCAAARIPVSVYAVYDHLAGDDVLACGMARLLLLTDNRPLPALGDAPAAWEYYLDNWRPGRPHESSWNDLYANALEAINE